MKSLRYILTSSSFALASLLCASAFAKGPSLGDLAVQINAPAKVTAGEAFDVEVKVDLDAFCKRSKHFAGAQCKNKAEEALATGQLVLDGKGPPGATNWMAYFIEGSLKKKTGTLYTGKLKTMKCQGAGIYRANSLEPNPALTGFSLEVETPAACAADKEPPQPVRLWVPASVGKGQAPIAAEGLDDYAGPQFFRVEVVDSAAEPLGSAPLGQMTDLACTSCDGKWLCSGSLELCPSGAAKNRVLRAFYGADEAGRAFEDAGITKLTEVTFTCGTTMGKLPADAVCKTAPGQGTDLGPKPGTAENPSTSGPDPDSNDEPEGGKAGLGCSAAPHQAGSASALGLMLSFAALALGYKRSRRARG